MKLQNIKMKVQRITDTEFQDYGRVLNGYDFTELFDHLKKTDIPDSGIIYVASEKSLESCRETQKIKDRGFGGYPVQLGYVNGKNRTMNCLEYHKSSEFNIAMDNIILILGHENDIKDGCYDSSLCKAFFLPAGTGVELYGTTLHYAPFHTEEAGYRVICVLPEGTNMPKPELDIKSTEDKMCFGINKWLMAHKDADEVGKGAYIGITGENISFDMLEMIESFQCQP